MENSVTIVNTHQSEAWNGYEGEHWAGHHERYDAVNRDLDEPLFAAAAIVKRDEVLDIGCGNGRSTRLAAHRAAHGQVFGIDLSAPMLDRARRLAREDGIANVTFEQGDAQVYPFPAAAFDVAISRGGIMYFADPVAAFVNIRRALRPGGRLAFVCGGGDAGDTDVIWSAMATQVPLPDAGADEEPGPASFTDPDRITEVLTAAGFEGVRFASAVNTGIYGRDAADAAEFIFGWGPVRFWLRDADPDSVRRARDAVTDALCPYERPDGVRLSFPLSAVTATVPE